ncbi:hypothetical protein Tsubulata_002593 [Turnera subulata]|uniref:DUF4283 domain-containing protein n=1 Tax=Turnera subulata TaxID=218843 RepID=A0A9Q0G9R3_9ROSI|nr:hypothetical protein Tsubulata_002593 [Turnera subulata]
MESSLFDDEGRTRTKAPLVIDLGKLVLPNPKLTPGSNAKTKAAVPVLAPVSFAPATTKSPEDHGLGASSENASIPLASVSTTIAPAAPSGASYAKVASRAPKNPQPLKFVEPMFTDDKSTISIPPELIAIGREKYSMCLIGKFLGNAPKMGLIQAVLNKLWGRDGAVSVSSYKEGLFLIQMPNEIAFSRALYRGRGMWVEGLSYLASAIGIPLHADQDCSKLFKSDCANVYTEVDFSEPLKNDLVVEINGEKVVIDISYSWKPRRCGNCKGWGHHELACSLKKSVTKWVPKIATVTAAAPVSTLCSTRPNSVAESIPTATFKSDSLHIN